MKKQLYTCLLIIFKKNTNNDVKIIFSILILIYTMNSSFQIKYLIIRRRKNLKLKFADQLKIVFLVKMFLKLHKNWIIVELSVVHFWLIRVLSETRNMLIWFE